MGLQLCYTMLNAIFKFKQWGEIIGMRNVNYNLRSETGFATIHKNPNMHGKVWQGISNNMKYPNDYKSKC